MNPRQNFDDYLNFQKRAIRECDHTLSQDCDMRWEVGNYVDDVRVIPLDYLPPPVSDELGLKMRNRTTWHYGYWTVGIQTFIRSPQGNYMVRRIRHLHI